MFSPKIMMAIATGAAHALETNKRLIRSYILKGWDRRSGPIFFQRGTQRQAAKPKHCNASEPVCIRNASLCTIGMHGRMSHVSRKLLTIYN
jgi:hypothetical protein